MIMRRDTLNLPTATLRRRHPTNRFKIGIMLLFTLLTICTISTVFIDDDYDIGTVVLSSLSFLHFFNHKGHRHTEELTFAMSPWSYEESAKAQTDSEKENPLQKAQSEKPFENEEAPMSGSILIATELGTKATVSIRGVPSREMNGNEVQFLESVLFFYFNGELSEYMVQTTSVTIVKSSRTENSETDQVDESDFTLDVVVPEKINMRLDDENQGNARDMNIKEKGNGDMAASNNIKVEGNDGDMAASNNIEVEGNDGDMAASNNIEVEGNDGGMVASNNIEVEGNDGGMVASNNIEVEGNDGDMVASNNVEELVWETDGGQRILQPREENDSITIVISVRGKYFPPPFISYNKEILHRINMGAGKIIASLAKQKASFPYFAGVTSIICSKTEDLPISADDNVLDTEESGRPLMVSKKEPVDDSEFRDIPIEVSDESKSESESESETKPEETPDKPHHENPVPLKKESNSKYARASPNPSNPATRSRLMYGGVLCCLLSIIAAFNVSQRAQKHKLSKKERIINANLAYDAPNALQRSSSSRSANSFRMSNRDSNSVSSDPSKRGASGMMDNRNDAQSIAP